MAEVIWTKKAFSQFEKEVKFVLEDRGISAAKIIKNKILQSSSLLEKNPEMGKKEPLLAHMKNEYRFIVVWSYKIIYRRDKQYIIVSRVFHTSRNPNKLKGI
ncbi:type II toxin-antitoxin system RelE/ParE family toxin [Hyphobacterium sp. CCMP332]|nr:type II toxin-antitoxin system RelE/ParE family toxin [Hyphobacterium sp. CCMP332]